MGDLLEPFSIQVLDVAADECEARLLLSLLPTESASAAASKAKGRISKWLSEQMSSVATEKALARGYFAVSIGQSTSRAIDAYLDQQSEHHGYSKRARPPIFVQRFEHDDEVRRKLDTDHAVTWLRYHIVMATQFRHGVFNSLSGEAVTESWLSLQNSCRILIDKVSFVPDHVHLAISMHPLVSPASVVLELMNTAQAIMWSHFETDVIKASVNRLWQSSAYIGSFGQLSSNAVSAYMKRWSQQLE